MLWKVRLRNRLNVIKIKEIKDSIVDNWVTFPIPLKGSKIDFIEMLERFYTGVLGSIIEFEQRGLLIRFTTYRKNIELA